MRRVIKSKKLLVASAGVATVTYLSGCEEPDYTTGNLMPAPEAPPEPEGSASAEAKPESDSTVVPLEAEGDEPAKDDQGAGGSAAEE